MATSGLAFAGDAQAEGGPSIAAATPIAVGQQEFGTTANGSQVAAGDCFEGGQLYGQYWSLGVTADDVLTIQWEAHAEYTTLELLPVGTTDFNVGSATAVAHQSPSVNGKNELHYTANVGGSLPVRVVDEIGHCGRIGGTYNFTVAVTHALSIALPHVSSLGRKGKLTVGVHNPEGGPITDAAVQIELQMKGPGSWQKIGAGTAATPVIAYKIPARLRHSRHTFLRAVAHGTGYAPASSAHLKIRTL